MTPVTLHQPLPSHWYISEARGYIPAVQNLLLWSLVAKVPSIGRAQSATAFSFAPTASLLQLPMDGGGLSTAALDEHKASAPPEGAGQPHRRPHHLAAITIVTGTIFTSEGWTPQSMARKAMESCA